MAPDFTCNFCGDTRPRNLTANMRDWEYGVAGEYDYLQCRSCGGIQLHPFPDLEDLKRAYAIDYHGYAVKERRGWLFSNFLLCQVVVTTGDMSDTTGKEQRYSASVRNHGVVLWWNLSPSLLAVIPTRSLVLPRLRNIEVLHLHSSPSDVLNHLRAGLARPCLGSLYRR